MVKKTIFTARALAKERGFNPDLIEKLVNHYSGGAAEAYCGVMGVKSGRGTKSTAWVYDLREGLDRFEELKDVFEGDELKAAAAHVTSEARVRAKGSEWRDLLPEGVA